MKQEDWIVKNILKLRHKDSAERIVSVTYGPDKDSKHNHKVTLEDGSTFLVDKEGCLPKEKESLFTKA